MSIPDEPNEFIAKGIIYLW